jgi:hypothetical protein
VASEGILVVGVVQELIQRQVNHLDMPAWSKVLWLMACTLGVLGVLLMVIQVMAQRSVAKTHEVAQALPLPAATLLMHAALFTGLFYLYAWVWNLAVWPLVAP